MQISSAQRWAALVQHLPPLPAAYHAAIAALAERQEFDAAYVGAKAAIELFPEDPAIARLAAHAAERRGDWPDAVAAWQRAELQSLLDHDEIVRFADAFLRAGRPNDAEALLAASLTKTPAPDAKDPAMRALLMQHARTAAARGDFATAKARWQALLRQIPDDPACISNLREIDALKLPETRDTAPWMKPPDEGEETPHAEPLGLLRWVGINYANICTALATQLAGIGEAEFTRLNISSVGEFSTSDSRYGLGMHTFMRDTGQDRDKLLGQLLRRMRFLREKLLEDLYEGDKIFVYRHTLNPPDRHLHKVLAAVRAYNPYNRLVVMRMLPYGAPGERLREFAPGALCGAVANGRKPVQGTGWDIDTAFWLETCQEAAERL
jgi:tetratricopeptide (TPR) repeat protein